ncbi:type VII secretion protein EsaA [Neobacillus mesonae]|uniref:Type VII secretion system accessory factor EsaA n=1 Tax=Neobacillus mesonae TaxID=1193713 RepID=A0A3Q9QTQ2_9BACI|nr:type VII secretion protein EsaA [Neobacillus mesonae]AZU60147.1 type VII secretion protein EsaA [Neobacillus mesonae]
MKRFKQGLLLFFVLVIALSSGISYLALNKAAKTNDEKKNQKMTIALVNQDQGSVLNGKTYDFGNEFIKNIEKDDQHNWYVVSRGVAENGLARNAYNMMIVIPDDFSKKALSLNSKDPEKVVLNYKVNTSGNSTMKVEADKTANTILGNFNRKIIDVYFASVIGNLHDAQDQIGSIIKQEQIYTNIYNSSIHQPLSGYTSQFGTVQENANLSMESFQGLQEILKGFENSLGEGVKTGSTYQTNFLDFKKMQDTNRLLVNGFSDQLRLFDNGLNHGDVTQQWNELLAANEAINKQFEQNDNQSITILSGSRALQEHLKTTKEKVDQLDADLAAQLESDMQGSIASQLKQALKNSSGEEKTIKLSNIFSKPDENAQKYIQNQIDKLPTLDMTEVDKLDLSEPTKIQLKNTIAVANKYNREFGYSPNTASGSLPLANQIKAIKERLKTDGTVLIDSVYLPGTKKKGQEFTVSMPNEFAISELSLTLPNHEEIVSKEPTLKLPATNEGQFVIKLKVNLKDENAKLDVFQPITWDWNLVQKDITDVDYPEPPEVEPIPGDGETDNGGSVETPTPEALAETQPGDGSNEAPVPVASLESGSSDGSKAAGNSVEATNSEPPAQTDPGEGEKDDGNNPEVPNPEPPATTEPGNGNGGSEKPQGKKVTIINNQIMHSVMSPLIDDSTSILMKGAIDSVGAYHQMQMLFGLYFGLGNVQFTSSNLQTELANTDLKDLATNGSLYSLFNKQDVVDVLADYVAGQITEEVRHKTEDLKGKIDGYLQLVDQAVANSDKMAVTIQQTTDQAKNLNTNLTKSLENLALWRENSLKLLEDEAKISTNYGNEQNMVVSLDGDFQSLLAESQSLAEQSKSNLNSAEGVYNTFDAIDKQAEAIKDSGADLIKDADHLSNNLTSKLLNDQKFAENFASVLANSRVGQRPNENLLGFLSNPVKVQNSGVISAAAADVFTPYFVVLICFIMAFFTAYAISTNERKRLLKDSFEEEGTLIKRNLPISMLTVLIGMIEGVLIGLLSGYLLEISQGKLMQWTGLIMLIVLTLLLAATYLLRQLRMIGMFILLVCLSIYLFFTKALGLHIDQQSFLAKIQDFSPLHYIEKLVTGFIEGGAEEPLILLGLLVVSVIGLIGHLFVVNGSRQSEELIQDEISEAH